MFVAFASEDVDRVARTLMTVRTGVHGHVHWIHPTGFGWSDGKGAATAAHGAAVAVGRASLHAIDSRPEALEDRAPLDLALQTYLHREGDIARLAGVFGF